MMRMRLTCKPPIKLEMVSWNPSEMAMPPMPSAVIAALTFHIEAGGQHDAHAQDPHGRAGYIHEDGA